MKTFNITQCFMREASTKPLAFLRIATGLVALTELLVLFPNWKDIYGSHGYIEWVISNTLFSMPNLPTMSRIAGLLNPQMFSDNMIMYSTLSLYIVCLCSLVCGFKSNLMACFAWMLHLTINNTANMYGYGVETFIHVSLFYLIFMPSSYHWTMFSRKQEAVNREARIYANMWLAILQVHLCIVYINAGLAKMHGEDWTSGEAFWRSVAQPSYGQFDMFWMAQIPWISIVSTYFVLLLEAAYPIFIWFRFSRLYWLVGTIIMHVGIALFMGLYAFSAIMIVLNVTAFGWRYVEEFARYLATRFSKSHNKRVMMPEAVN